MVKVVEDEQGHERVRTPKRFSGRYPAGRVASPTTGSWPKRGRVVGRLICRRQGFIDGALLMTGRFLFLSTTHNMS